MSTLRTGARTPFFATDILDIHDLEAGYFSPLDDLPAVPTLAQLSACDVFIKNGFVVCNATDNSGYLSVITWEQFQLARQRVNKALVDEPTTLATIVPVRVYLASGDWVMTPVVKVFQAVDSEAQTTTTAEDGSYASTIVSIQIGTIR